MYRSTPVNVVSGESPLWTCATNKACTPRAPAAKPAANAFLREFIATLYAERKKHLLVITVMLAVVYAMIGMLYLSHLL